MKTTYQSKNELTKGKRILLFPLANVLGHLSRTLSLAEELYHQGQEVFIVISEEYKRLEPYIQKGIHCIKGAEMPSETTKQFGQIAYNPQGEIQLRELLEQSNPLDSKTLKERALLLDKIIEHDTKLIQNIQPDAIVLDYHYPPLLSEAIKETPVFLLSHYIGFPSLFSREYGDFPYPLHQYTKLVPGITSFENMSPKLKNQWKICGEFSWKGWKQTSKTPELNDVFLFFGSTGCTEKLTPWFINHLSPFYKLSYINQEDKNEFIHLDRFLQQTSVVICHGGHGTVMACIKQQTPMLIIPNNLEQLEIGRRIEELKLGKMICKPYLDIDIDVLLKTIEFLKEDLEIKKHLEQVAGEFQEHGEQLAAKHIINQLYQSKRQATLEQPKS